MKEISLNLYKDKIENTPYEDAYRFSQNLDYPWIENAIHHKAVTTFKSEARSSSIGDIFVDSCGFSLVNKGGW